MIMETLWNARKKIIGIGAIVLLMMLMMNLNSRLGEYFNLSTQRDLIRTEVNNDSLTQIAMETQVAYATSDQAVEDWARGDAHMSRPDDKVIVPLTPVGQVTEQAVPATPTVRVVENYEVWWALFFGQ